VLTHWVIMNVMTDFLTGYVLQAGAGLGGDPGLKASRCLTGGALSVLETSIDAGEPPHVHDRGCRIEYLATSTPVEELGRAVGASRRDLVVLAATTPEIIEPLRAEHASFARRAPLALGGAGATPEIASEVGVRLMAGEPVTEAELTGWPR
jgi:hypothetical protein